MFVYLNGRRVWVELQAADGGGNDGGGDDALLPKGQDQSTNVLKSFESLLKRHGDNANAVAQLLFNENKELRDTKRELERKLPADGSLVLTGTDATDWATYKALGKPDEVKTFLDERTQLQGKLSGMERETLLRTVADAAGYKSSVLANLDRMAKAEGKALAFEVRDVTIDGKPVKTAFVKDGDKEAALTDYAQNNWTDFMPSLAAQGAAATPPPGTRYLAQHAGNGGGEKQTTKNVAENTLNRAYAARKDKE